MVKKKILIFGMPGTGHLNPLIPILSELTSKIDVEIIIYLTDDFKEKIESIGSKVTYKPCIPDKLYKDFEKKNSSSKNTGFGLNVLINFHLDIADQGIDFIVNEIDKECPDLVIYDFLAMYFRLAVKYYKKCLEAKENQKTTLKFRPTNPLPPLVCFSASFWMDDEIFPNSFERSIALNYSLWDIFQLLPNMIFLIYKQWSLCSKFGLDFMLPLDNLPGGKEKMAELVLVSVMPELQPRSHLFDESRFRFIGSTSISDLVEDKRSNEEPFKSIFKEFPATNPSFETFEAKKKLVYVSLGTVFNNQTDLFEIIINAFNEIDLDLTVVISTGSVVLEILKNKMHLPNNILLVKSAPQVDLLKRAALFITHCGMNSTSESIHFGVPMVCIPIAVDQPLVAYRVADNLGIGIMYKASQLSSIELKNGIKKILENKGFVERAISLSKYSRNYKGRKEGAKLIEDILQN